MQDVVGRGDTNKLALYFYTGKTKLILSGYVDGWLVGGKHNISTSFVLLDTEMKTDPVLINLDEND